MLRITLSLILVAFLIPSILAVHSGTAAAQGGEDWRTPFELSDSLRSPRYEQTVEYLRRLTGASPWIRLTSFGVTPRGRDLPLVILSRDGYFTPQAAQASGREIVLIQAGIHAGEPDGKDAGMMLLRDIAVTQTESALARNAIILFIPIFNLDGHERQSRYNRINQDGPEEMGWRVTAQNLNLNRDYLKADSPEMRAFLRLYNEWLPDMFVDCHVTDGMDFQYTVSFSMEMFSNCDSGIREWQAGLRNTMADQLSKAGESMVPYVWPREGYDIRSGMSTWAAPPRFSTGYAAVRNRASLLIETHSLKPYPARVRATYQVLKAVLVHVNRTAGALREAVSRADHERSTIFASPNPTIRVPLSFEMSDGFSERDFLAYRMDTLQSSVSGGTYPLWHRDEPQTLRVRVYDDVVPSVAVVPPHCYLLPQEWEEEAEILRLHGIRLSRLIESASIPVETYRFHDPVFQNRPYEGRFRVRAKKETRKDTVTYPAGTYVVYLNQPSSHAAIHLLEPDGPDSFLQWGFFNGIFEQKEYYENYVMERIASEMLAADPTLRKEFETQLKTDTAFAASPGARLDFFYQRSPYFDRQKDVYPIGRCLDGSMLPITAEEQYNRTSLITR